MTLDGGKHPLFEFREDRFEISGMLRLEPRVPAPFDREIPVWKDQIVPGRKLPNLPEHRPRRGDDAQGEVFVQGLSVELRQTRIQGKEGFDLRREREGLSVVAVIKRLLPEVGAGHEKFPFPEIVNAEGKHTAQFLQTFLALILV